MSAASIFMLAGLGMFWIAMLGLLWRRSLIGMLVFIAPVWRPSPGLLAAVVLLMLVAPDLAMIRSPIATVLDSPSVTSAKRR